MGVEDLQGPLPPSYSHWSGVGQRTDGTGERRAWWAGRGRGWNILQEEPEEGST